MKQPVKLFIKFFFFLFLSINAFSQDEKFELRIEQGGLNVPIKDNNIELTKSPFTLIVVFNKPTGVYVNSYINSKLFKKTQKNKDLKDKVAIGSNVMSESNFNEDKEIMLSVEISINKKG